MSTLFVSERLVDESGIDTFACGRPQLEVWLREHALPAQKQGTARTTVWREQSTHRVVAYYSIAPTQIARADLSGRLAGGHAVVPGFILARLALDRTLQGQGLGGQLLFDALETICAASDLVGGRVIVVDPIDRAARDFYLHFDFVPIERSERERLYMLVKDARTSLGLAPNL